MIIQRFFVKPQHDCLDALNMSQSFYANGIALGMCNFDETPFDENMSRGILRF